MADGNCKPIGVGSGQACWDKAPCSPTIVRTWSGLPPHSALEFCAQDAIETVCVQDPPDAGPTGSGEDTRGAAALECGAWRNYSIATACGLSATVNSTCSACELQGQ